jgi:hypothetical protein
MSIAKLMLLFSYATLTGIVVGVVFDKPHVIPAAIFAIVCREFYGRIKE